MPPAKKKAAKRSARKPAARPARTLKGYAAIDHARKTGGTLNKYADPTEGARTRLTVSEASSIAREDASLIWTYKSKPAKRGTKR